MKEFIIKRLLSLLFVLLGISLLTFSLSYFAPGDPAELILDQAQTGLATEEEVASLRQEMGLDQPFYLQYGRWLSHMVIGDAGISYKTKEPVFYEIEQHLPVTLLLSLLALLWAVIGSLALGILLVRYENSVFAKILQFLARIVLSLPSFLCALLLLLLFTQAVPVLPTHGIDSPLGYLLPSLSLSLLTMAMAGELLYARLKEEQGKLYMKVAKARGLSAYRLLLRYALPNAILPLIAFWGNYFGAILGGSVIIENLFALPGIGSMALEAIRYRDYPLLEGYVFFTGIVFVFVTLVVDLLAYWLDPRMARGGVRHAP